MEEAEEGPWGEILHGGGHLHVPLLLSRDARHLLEQLWAATCKPDGFGFLHPRAALGIQPRTAPSLTCNVIGSSRSPVSWKFSCNLCFAWSFPAWRLLPIPPVVHLLNRTLKCF